MMNRQWAYTWILCFGLCLSLTTCAPKFPAIKITDVSVDIMNPNTQEVDLDIAFTVATQKIQEVLPEAYFWGMVFSGKCQNLPRLRGKLVLIFEQVRPAFFKQQVVSGDASIDTVIQTMNLDFKDETDFYPLVRRGAFVGDRSFKEIAALAHRHIMELGLSDCDVTITQLENSWDVRCGALGNFIQECRFEITNGQIREKRK